MKRYKRKAKNDGGIAVASKQPPDLLKIGGYKNGTRIKRRNQKIQQDYRWAEKRRTFHSMG